MRILRRMIWIATALFISTAISIVGYFVLFPPNISVGHRIEIGMDRAQVAKILGDADFKGAGQVYDGMTRIEQSDAWYFLDGTVSVGYTTVRSFEIGSTDFSAIASLGNAKVTSVEIKKSSNPSRADFLRMKVRWKVARLRSIVGF